VTPRTTTRPRAQSAPPALPARSAPPAVPAVPAPPAPLGPRPPRLARAPAPPAGHDGGLDTDSADARAFRQHEAAIRAFPATTSPRLAATLLVAEVEARVPLFHHHRDAMCALPTFDPTWCDELGSLAAATRSAALGPRLLLPPPHQARVLLRALSHTEATLRLALRLRLRSLGHPDDALRSPRDRRVAHHRAGEVLSLVSALRAVGCSEVGLTPEALDQAEAQAVEVLALGTKAQRTAPGPEQKQARELRDRALSLLRAVYEELRAALLYVGRYEVGLAAKVPAFWALRGAKVGRRGGGR
jgi:hypothetical protein